MEFFGLLGERLGHSLSAPIHHKVFDKLGWPGAYKLMEIPREKFAQAGEAIRLLGVRGVNVTIPYKLEIMPQLDEVDAFALQVGAVNTVHNRQGILYGYNTDVYGLMEMLRFHGLQVNGHCCVLGSGGAARSACTALEALGAEKITVISRTPQKQDWGPRVTFKGYDDLAAMTGSLMINATPVGMYPHTEASPVTQEQMQGFQGFADLIYNPSQTQFTLLAKAMGRPWCTGLYMLVAQAVKAEEIWWETPIPASVTQAIYEEMRKELHL
ncbi:MAG: shikimate dehydrogenase [Clostridia bacterium]|nr:shikimate dehydrogenase [Clostridia bacterium]